MVNYYFRIIFFFSLLLGKTLITLTLTAYLALLLGKVSYKSNNIFYSKNKKNFIYFCRLMKDFLLVLVERC
ncbi:hypothetical protein NP83_02310 [Neobacillus niacini]|nr:hypothetical protein NP83_02310 [Neobacillus niacini]